MVVEIKDSDARAVQDGGVRVQASGQDGARHAAQHIQSQRPVTL